MAHEDKQLLAFNRGVVSSRGLGRVDVERIALSADIQCNYMPRVLGSMMLRPGMNFLDRTKLDNAFKSRELPFVFDVDDTAMLEMSPVKMRVRIDDVLITRPTVTAAITDPGFNSALGVGANDWQDQSETGGTALTTGGVAKMKGDGTDFGIIQQLVTVNESGTEHSLDIAIQHGPVRFKVGSVAGQDDYFTETRLGVGTHSLAFTPTGDFIIEFANEREFDVWILSCNLDSNETMELTTPYADEDLPRLRWVQSGDVIYVACKNETPTGIQYNAERQIKIERRGDGRSWSVVTYLPEDGPFKVQNVSGVTLTPSALVGDINLTASQPFFTAEHATFSTLFRIASQGQIVTESISSENVFTDPIRIVGAEAARVFSLIISGRTDSTITLQFAFTDDGPWNDISPQYTANTSSSYDDGQDDQVIYYRLGIKTGDYGTDTVVCTLNYTGGSIQGVARVRSFTSSTVVTAQVLKDFGATTASKDWWEGEWSAHSGYPTANGIHEGRLVWAGKDKIWGSVSDAYESFDDNVEGDSGPISRSIGEGPIRTINWLLSMARLLMGTAENSANIAAQRMDGNNPLSARSNSFEEPLTPTNFNIKTTSSRGVFVDRTEQRLYELTYDIDMQDYKSVDLSVFTPDFNEAGIVQIAVQMKPDIRVHCVRSDGTVGVLVYDRLENVICWIDITSPGADGEIEDVAVLPGVVEDQVYYTIKRTINAGTQRHLCKWALESEATGGLMNKIADSFVEYDGTSTTAPFTTELLHLRDEEVEVWADGVDVGPLTVSATGGLTLTTAAEKVVAGLGYTAQFKSAKLGSISGIGLLDNKMVNRIGFIAENTHVGGLKYGPDFDNLYDLPLSEDGQSVDADTVYSEYHEENFDFGGEWDPDSRICLQSAAPKPCTLIAAIADVESVEEAVRRR